MDMKEVKDTLSAAKVYMSSLQKLNSEIENAEKQIKISALETEKNIVLTFSKVLDSLTQVLNERRENLLANVEKIKSDGLTPLKESHKIISEKIEQTNNLIDLSDCILSGVDSNIDDYTNQSALLGSLPEVPELKEVPYITFQCEQNVHKDLQKMCSQLGAVSPIAPIQISQMLEKPGAILIEWQNIDLEDRLTDIQEFRLQKAAGNVISNKEFLSEFVDCYTGSDTQFLIKDLQINHPYSFRVCCKFEGCSNWSPWSLPQVSLTTVKPYSWADHKDFFMFNENRIAVSANDKPNILFSNGPQFRIDYTIEFTILEVGSEDFCIGLVYPDFPSRIGDIKIDPTHSFLIDRSGAVFVDGAKKSTHLPVLFKGVKVGFTGELVKDKIWINVDSSDKIVTYEWSIQPDRKLYFAAAFHSKNMKIMVE